MNRIVLLAGLAALLGGCGPDPIQERSAAQDFDSSTTAHFCSMALSEHPGPKGQILLTDRPPPLWFATVRDMFAATMMPEEPKNIAAIYVTDLGRTEDWDHVPSGNWIEARDAWFVVGSDVEGGMGGGELLPFARVEDARAYTGKHGGQVKRFSDIREHDVFDVADEEHRS